jgi:hypothetical protein
VSATTEFYLAQAQRCTAEADASGLDRVRERNLRAAAAWQAMADKLLHTEKLRAEKVRVADAMPE